MLALYTVVPVTNGHVCVQGQVYVSDGWPSVKGAGYLPIKKSISDFAFKSSVRPLLSAHIYLLHTSGLSADV